MWLIRVMLVISILIPASAMGVCKGIPLNPITDVCWQCMFPVKIGGVPVTPGAPGLIDTPDLLSSPVCVCPTPIGIPRPGITLSFWEPARFIETVKDPFCFPSLGTGLSVFNFGMGTNESSEESTDQRSLTSAQAHYFIFPVTAILELITDELCLELSGFDLGYITEPDPLWQDHLLAFLINPEALLFGNPVAQLACIPDSISTQVGLPLDPLFWCVGSWGGAYPLAGATHNTDYVEANAHLAAKMVYKMARELLIQDPAVWICAAVPTPIWIKSHYRIHVAKPVRDFMCHTFGRSGLIWTTLKNPPVVGDNFLWMLFRKRACCLL